MTAYARNKIDPFLFSALILLLSTVSFSRNLVWRDELTMWNNVRLRSPGKWRPHYKMGLILYLKENPQAALLRFNTALRLKPDAYGLHNNAGLSYQKMGMRDEAVRAYTLAIEKEGGASAYLNLGTVYLEEGNLERALGFFLKAVEKEPDDASALLNAGFTYGDMGEYGYAIEMHKRALSVNPFFYHAHFGLGLAYEGTGQYGEAAFHWRQYLRYAPEEEGWRALAGRHLERLKGGGPMGRPAG